MFLGPGVHVDVILACTTYLNVVSDQDFPSKPRASNCLCQLAFFPPCTHTWTHDVKEIKNCQTKLPSPVARWLSSDVHMPIAGDFGGGRESVWAHFINLCYIDIVTHDPVNIHPTF